MRKRILAIILVCLNTPALAQSTRWVYQSHVDPILGTQTMIAITAGDRGEALTAGCGGGRPAVRVTTAHSDREIGDMREVTWRIDQTRPVTQIWKNQQQGGAMLSGSVAIELIERLRDAQEHVVVHSGGHIAKFSVKGSTAAIKQLISDCPRLRTSSDN